MRVKLLFYNSFLVKYFSVITCSNSKSPYKIPPMLHMLTPTEEEENYLTILFWDNCPLHQAIKIYHEERLNYGTWPNNIDFP